MVPLVLVFGRNDYLLLWLAVLILSVFTLIGVYLVLPRGKGIFTALIWLTGATGQNEFSDSSDLHDLVIPKRPAVLELRRHHSAPAWLLKRIRQNMKILMIIIPK